MKVKTQNRNWFVQIINAPVRLLRKARDMYVRKMSDYADRMSYVDFGCPGGQFSGLPRSFSSASSMRSSSGEEDLQDLIRAASARAFGDRIDVDAILKQQLGRGRSALLGPKVLPKSCSVGMGRIDEDIDITCDDKDVLKHPRSRSYAAQRQAVSLH